MTCRPAADARAWRSPSRSPTRTASASRAAHRHPRCAAARGAVREVCDLLLRRARDAGARHDLPRCRRSSPSWRSSSPCVVLSGGAARERRPGDRRGQPRRIRATRPARRDMVADRRRRHAALHAGCGAGRSSSRDQGLVELQQVRCGFRDASGNRVDRARRRAASLPRTAACVKLDGAVHVAGVLPGADEPADITTEHLAFDTNAADRSRRAIR